MPPSTPPPATPVAPVLSLGGRPVDLTVRGLVMGVVAAPRWAREAEVLAGVRGAAEAGADVVEVPADPRLIGPAAAQRVLPTAVRVASAAAARAALAAGAELVLVPDDHWDEVTEAAGGMTQEAGGMTVQTPAAIRSDRMVVLVDGAVRARQEVNADPFRPVAVDVTRLSGADAIAQESLALAVGARLVRTGDLRRSRRVVEVLAQVVEARR